MIVDPRKMIPFVRQKFKLKGPAAGHTFLVFGNSESNFGAPNKPFFYLPTEFVTAGGPGTDGPYYFSGNLYEYTEFAAILDSPRQLVWIPADDGEASPLTIARTRKLAEVDGKPHQLLGWFTRLEIIQATRSHIKQLMANWIQSRRSSGELAEKDMAHIVSGTRRPAQIDPGSAEHAILMGSPAPGKRRNEPLPDDQEADPGDIWAAINDACR